MKKEKKKLKDRVTKNQLYIAKGVFLCLFAIMGMVNYTPFAQFFTYCISFFVGTIISYIVYLIILLYGISLIAGKKVRVKMSFLLIGLVLITLGVMIIFTNSMYSGVNSYLTFSGLQIDGQTYSYLGSDGTTLNNFANAFKESFSTFPKIDYSKNVGIIGLTLTCIINSTMSNIGSYCFGGVFISLGTVFVLLKLVVRFGKYLNNYIKHLKKKEKEQEFKDAKDVVVEDVEKNIVVNSENVEKSTENTSFLSETKVTEEEHKEKENVDNNQIKKENNESNYIYINRSSNSTGLTKAVFDDSFFSSDLTKEKETKAVEKPKNSTQEHKKQVVENNYTNENNATFTKPSFEENISSNYTQNEVEAEEKKEPISNMNPIKEEISFDDNSKNDIRDEYSTNEVYNEPVVNNDVEEVEVEEVKPTLVENMKKQVEEKVDYKNYAYPPSSLLRDRGLNNGEEENTQLANERVNVINEFCKNFGVRASVVGYTIGPSVTRYDLKPEPNYSIKNFDKYLDDLSIQLNGSSARFEAVIPGKSTSGIEVPNAKRATVEFKDVFEHLPPLRDDKFMGMFVPFGKNISGEYINLDYTKFPHLLVCGTTGSGKSVFMHSIILSLVMRNSPETFRLLIIDPKRVEFTTFDNIPHLLCPVVTEASEAYIALQKVVQIMEERYEILREADLVDLKEYNETYAKEHNKRPIPFILVVVDEYSNLVSANKNIGTYVKSLSEKARACGIHLMVATQAPRASVIDGVIKSNFSSRVSLLCASQVDSLNIIDKAGGENLLGNGDLLFKTPLLANQGGLIRIQSALVEKVEEKNVCSFIRNRYKFVPDAHFINLVEDSVDESAPLTNEERLEKKNDAIYEAVKKACMEQDYFSISKIARGFNVGFTRAGKIFEQLRAEGIIEKQTDSSNSAKGTKVLVHSSNYGHKDNPGSGADVAEINYSIKGE